MKDAIITQALDYVHSLFHHDPSGHDYYHTLRVVKTATQIAQEEGANLFLVQLAAALHDVDDVKLSPETAGEKGRAVAFMRAYGLDEDVIAAVCHMIGEVSYIGTDSVVPDTLEGKIVQDADRLDAMGAIGIARVFAYGGHRGRMIYEPDIPPVPNMNEAQYRACNSPSINHFYEKLLLLKDSMNTAAGKRLAQGRHAYMEGFLSRFFAEWDGTQ